VHFGKLSFQSRREHHRDSWIGQVVIDSHRADEIAAFWPALIDRPVNDGANQFFALIPASEDRTFPVLMFLGVPEPRQGKNRLHLDLVATDLPAEVEPRSLWALPRSPIQVRDTPELTGAGPESRNRPSGV
jgi:hypothetical protein